MRARRACAKRKRRARLDELSTEVASADRAEEKQLFRFGVLPVVAAILLGILIGVGAVTFVYAEGTSYLSTDPAACANCHIMWPQYDAWQKASHHTVATCVDCHLPDDFVGKYVAKAENGWNHSKAFTLQDFPEPIVITEKNARLLHANCLRCHGDFVHAQGGTDAAHTPRCVRCHADVGHGVSAGLGGPWNRELDTAAPGR